MRRERGNSFYTVCIAILPLVSVYGSISRTGFQNLYYQGLAYNGSRVLEQLQDQLYSEYLVVSWTQSIAIDYKERVWLVDRRHHVVVFMPPRTRYIPWQALYQDYAGRRGERGSDNGSRLQAKFDSPGGIAVSLSDKEPFVIYIADTNNHVIRKIENNRVNTLVGLKKVPGLTDGPTKDARLHFPQSLGLDLAGENLMVLDNDRRVRHVKVSLAVPTITTLVDGACRSIARNTYLTSIVVRQVGCHTDWHAEDTGDTSMRSFSSLQICLGHQASCGPRHHPAIADEWSPQLLPRPTTSTTSTSQQAAWAY